MIFLKEENVTLEEGVSSIGNECFEFCSNLSTITIPSSVSSIGKGCFSGCNNLNVILPDNITEIKIQELKNIFIGN